MNSNGINDLFSQHQLIQVIEIPATSKPPKRKTALSNKLIEISVDKEESDRGDK